MTRRKLKELRERYPNASAAELQVLKEEQDCNFRPEIVAIAAYGNEKAKALASAFENSPPTTQADCLEVRKVLETNPDTKAALRKANIRFTIDSWIHNNKYVAYLILFALIAGLVYLVRKLIK